MILLLALLLIAGCRPAAPARARVWECYPDPNFVNHTQTHIFVHADSERYLERYINTGMRCDEIVDIAHPISGLQPPTSEWDCVIDAHDGYRCKTYDPPQPTAQPSTFMGMSR